MAYILLLVSLFLLLGQSRANVEKTIFLGPPSSPNKYSFLSDLPHLSPQHHTIRTQLHSKFEHSPIIEAIPSIAWYILDALRAGARYEVRICWAAVQPTAFDLETFTWEQVRDNKLLPFPVDLGKEQGSGDSRSGAESWLLLRVKAQADYFTTNQTLMQDGLIVDVDLILDPYVLNVVPKSLLPTGLHILVIALGAAMAVRVVLKHLDSVVGLDENADKDKKKA